MKRDLPHVICATLQDLDLRDASVAAVGCFDVLEHIEDDEAFVRRHRSDSATGRNVLCDPARKAMAFGPRSDIYAGHFRRHDEKSVSALLGGQFDVAYFTFFFGCLTLPLFLMKAIPYRLGISRERPNVWTHETEHGTDGGLAVSLLERILNKETRIIRKGKSKSWGASCLAVARRKR